MIWKQVVGYEGTYEVSEFGDVRRVVYYDKRERDPGLLRPAPDTYGYLQVALVLNGKSKAAQIHTIVANAFLGPKPKGMERNHKDGNKLNNHYSNLEYVTHGDNIRHAFRQGLYPVGEASKASKLTEAEVRRIRSMYVPGKKGAGAVSISRQFNVTSTTVWAILRGKTWKHVQLIESKQREAAELALKGKKS